MINTGNGVQHPRGMCMKDYWHNACKPAVDYRNGSTESYSSNTHFGYDNRPLCDLRLQKAGHRGLWGELKQVYENWRVYKNCTKQFGANPTDNEAKITELDAGNVDSSGNLFTAPAAD